ncbi:hypothetical protein FH972_008361 [Carpinus fangiana]|uniref:Uncharacterized protein n=1 Tax=Carpinus fangiana TaxID=176857 RepID=A0A5N6R1I6_9ROSI|nr:hypothetical protein FH972_008361 [Carpinus fangiana]
MYSVLGLRARLHRWIGLVGEDSNGEERGPVVDPGVEEAPGLVRARGRFEMEDLHLPVHEPLDFLVKLDEFESIFVG